MNMCTRRALKRHRLLSSVIAIVALSGCSTTSFAPPEVQVDRKITAGRLFSCNQLDVRADVEINKDVYGSIDLINNFIRAYRCAAHEAADGRQVFEIPSMLGMLVAGVGPALGLNSDAALVASAGAAFYGRANSYYAPKEKAAVLDTALDAVLCVKAAAVGFDYFDTRGGSLPVTTQDIEQAEAEVRDATQELANAESLQKALAQHQRGQDISANQLTSIAPLLQQEGASDPATAQSAQIAHALAAAKLQVARLAETKAEAQATLASLRSSFDLPRIHYEMVSTALFSIERVLAQRLSNVGNFDSAGIAAEFEKLAGKEEEAQDDKKNLEKNNPTKDGKSLTAGTEEYREEKWETELELMQAKLQKCVVRAKV